MHGHIDLKTTPVYLQVSIHQLKHTHSATHPAKLNSKPAEAAEKK
jgi:site-specific recombinase XerD